MSTTAGIGAQAATNSPGATWVDPNVALWTTRLADANTAVQQYEEQLRQAQETLDRFGGIAPPISRKIPGTWGIDPRQERNPDYDTFAQAESIVRKLGKVKDGTAGTGQVGEAKAYQDALKAQEEAQTKLASAQKSSAASSTVVRDIGGRPSLVDTTTGRATPITVEGGTGKRQKQEKGPDGKTYIVTYNVDAQGNETWDGQKPVPLDLGTDPGAAVALQTAEVNLQRAQQQLAQANDPLQRAQLQAQVEQAQFNLQQARAKAPLELQIQQTNLAQAQANLNRPSVQTVSGRAVGINPNTGEQVFNTDLMSAQDRARSEETANLQLETARRGQLPQNPLAAYTQETARLQETARQELARLQELQRTGALSETDASRQFNEFFKRSVETPLAGLRAQAEEAQRLEREQNAQRQREEDWRAFSANQVREQAGLSAGNTARQQAIAIAPQVRTPQFLQQYGQAVANMSQRAGAPNAEAALAMPAGQRITADTFNPQHFMGAIPDIEAYAQQATQRALSSISPAVAARVGTSMPQLPGLPDLSQLLSQLPYQGPLAAAPRNQLPLPGQEALDIGGGMARTMYSPTSYLDWAIPG